MSKPTYPHSRYVQGGGRVRRGNMASLTRDLRNVLLQYWPRFPVNGPEALVRGTLTAKKWRRALYWARQIRK